MKKEKQSEAAVIPPGEFKLIKRSLIRTRPQIRRTFNEASLAELADSIRVNGIVQPLVVRLVKATHKVLEPDLTCVGWRLVEIATGDLVAEEQTEIMIRTHPLEGALEDYYELIMGERRLRGAQQAGLTEVPCVVREATEAERFAWQFIENHVRENVSMLEEAEAIQAQLDERQAAVPAFAVEDLATELGMSRAAVYERLKLTRLSAAVKEVLESGRISTSVAQVVATMPTPKDQEKILKVVTNEQDYRFPFSVRKVQELTESFMRQLDDAPFDRAKVWQDEGTSCPLPACTGCPHRTGNMLAEFPELKGRPNVCTDPACYVAKCKAHYSAEAERFRKAGHVVLTADEMDASETDYTWVNQVIYAQMRNGPAKELAGKYAPKTVMVVSADGLEEYYVTEKFRKAAAKNGVTLFPEHKAEPAVTAVTERKERLAKEEEERKEKAIELARKTDFVWSLLPALKKELARLKDGLAWELAETMIKRFDQYDQDEAFTKVLVKEVPKGKARLLGMLFSGFDANPIQYVAEWNKQALKYWLVAGIDVEAEWKKHEKVTQAELVIPKSGPKQKTLLDVPATPTKRKVAKVSPAA